MKKIPSKERQQAWLRAARQPYTPEEENEARRKLTLMLDKIEASLAQHAWLVGDRYSIADIAQVPFIKRMEEEIIPDEMSAAKHPRVHDWWKKIQARPAFAEARIEGFVTTL
jgi:glutathione S-transferase